MRKWLVCGALLALSAALWVAGRAYLAAADREFEAKCDSAFKEKTAGLIEKCVRFESIDALNTEILLTELKLTNLERTHPIWLQLRGASQYFMQYHTYDDNDTVKEHRIFKNVSHYKYQNAISKAHQSWLDVEGNGGTWRWRCSTCWSNKGKVDCDYCHKVHGKNVTCDYCNNIGSNACPLCDGKGSWRYWTWKTASLQLP